MRILDVAGAIRQAIQDLVLLELQFIKGQIKHLDEKIDSALGEIRTLDRKLDATRCFHECLARLEAKVGIME